jgi:hypothetical protein
LKFWRYCPAEDNWDVVDKGEETIGTIKCGDDNITIYDSGVNTTDNFVYAKLSHFSVYGVSGSVFGGGGGIFGGGGTLGGGGSSVPNPLQASFLTLSSSVMNDIIQQLGLTYKEFYTAPLPLASTLIVCGEYPAPSDLSAISLGKPVESVEGDVYELSAKWVMDHFLFVNTLIIARGDIPVDSMAGIAYAKSMNLPILLTKPDSLPDAIQDALQELKPSKVIILGGTEAVSMEVEAELEEIATVERMWGATRFDTAVELANEISNPTVIVISSGYNPSVDAVISAAGYKAPLLFVEPNEVPTDVAEYIKANPRAKIIFDSTVSDAIKTQIEGLE